MKGMLSLTALQAAQGKIPCDTLLKNITYLDVFQAKWLKGDLAIADGLIVGTEPGLKATREIDFKGKTAVPGFIDAHVHVESSLMTPEYFEQAVLPKGTTTAICDPHEIANVLGVAGIQYFLDAASHLHMDLWVMLSSCVPATHMETNGGGILEAKHLTPLKNHPRALGLAEMMNVPGVLAGDPKIFEKLEAFAGRPVDGHAPLLRGRALNAYAIAGITTCHESSELEEAREKLSKGFKVWIREGSVARDLEALIPLLELATSTSIGFCTDDRNPFDIAESGHVDHLVRGALKAGVPPEVAYRAASWTVARHYGLDQGASRIGAIAPGYQADFIVLEDMRTCAIRETWKNGRLNTELPKAKLQAHDLRNTIKAKAPQAEDLKAPSGQVHVIEVIEGKIITDRSVASSTDPTLSNISVLERYGRGSKPSNAYVRGFGPIQGAIGSSVGHDSHNLVAVGSDTQDMATAFRALIDQGGGFCVVKDQKVLATLPLPFGGLMSDQDPETLRKEIAQLKKASRAIGCTLTEPFLQLAFLCLPVIPSLKITDKGLVDVDAFRLIDVRA